MEKVKVVNTTPLTSYNNYTHINSIIVERDSRVNSGIFEINKDTANEREWRYLLDKIKCDYYEDVCEFKGTLCLTITKNPKRYKCLNVTTGQVFDSLTACSASLGAVKQALSNQFNKYGFAPIRVKGNLIVLL